MTEIFLTQPILCVKESIVYYISVGNGNKGGEKHHKSQSILSIFLSFFRYVYISGGVKKMYTQDLYLSFVFDMY